MDSLRSFPVGLFHLLQHAGYPGALRVATILKQSSLAAIASSFSVHTRIRCARCFSLQRAMVTCEELLAVLA